MRNKYRYIFGGHAIVAEIHRPKGECGILGATALPVAGGCARVADVGPQEWEIPGITGRNSFQSGSSFVSGEFTTGDTRSHAKTITAASLKGLNLLGRLSADALSVELISEASSEEDEPTFAFGAVNPATGKQDETLIQGLRVDGVPVRVELDRSALHVTLEKLREKLEPLLTRSLVKLSFPPDTKAKSDVAIEHGNTIRIASLRVHFGELVIGHAYRNVTLFRISVGEDQISRDSGPGVASGPSGYPP
jgi:hypothetical protein